MREELDKQLCEKYPLMFKDRHGDPMDTLMCWGFEHGDGWYQIINNLCDNIQHYIDWSHKSHAWDIKWNEEHADEPRPVREIVPQVVVDQVKENSSFYKNYYIRDGERPDNVSHRLYENPRLHWTFYLMNDHIREQGWPLTQRSIVEKVKEDQQRESSASDSAPSLILRDKPARAIDDCKDNKWLKND